MFGITWRKLAAAASIAFAAAFLLCGYEFVRSSSQSLFIGIYGRQRLPVVMALAPVGTLGFVYVYGALLSFFGAGRAMVLTTLGSAAIMIGCFAGIVDGWRPAAGILYVVREAYIVLLVEQVWSFINSVINTAEGRRLNGPICGVASLGAISGGLLVSRLSTGLTTAHLIVIAAASLIPVGILAVVAYRIGGEPAPESSGVSRKGHLAIRHLASEPILIRIAVLVLVSQVISTVSDLAMNARVASALPDLDERTRWFGGLYAHINMWSAVFQFIIAPLVLRVARIRIIHIAVPMIHLVTGLLVLCRPSLAAAAVAYGAFKVLDYSVFRAAKEILYIPLSFDARYRVKELIDSVGYRLSKGGVSAALAVAGTLLAIPDALYPSLHVVAAAGWFAAASGVNEPAETTKGKINKKDRLDR